MRYRIARLFSSIYRSLYFPPVVIAAAILVATGVTWHSATQSLAIDRQDAVNQHIGITERSVRDTLNSYEEILQGGVGLFKGSDDVTAADWSHFLAAFDIQQNYPSAQTIGFMHAVKRDDIGAFTTYMQNQPGFSDFQVHSYATGTALDPNSTVFAPVTYAQAVTLQTPINFGKDGYADPARRKAMLEARDTGTTTLTGQLTLRPMGDKNTYSGFILFVPYYGNATPATASERRNALTGYVYASFRADLFFAHAARNAVNNTSAYRVRANGAMSAQPLYQSPNYTKLNKQGSVLHTTRTLSMYGQHWDIDYVFRQEGLLSVIQLRRPAAVLVAGGLSATLIALVVLLLLKARSHELTVQKERAVELAKDELLSLASHQLRTPATGVKQYLGMILQGFAGDVTKEQMSLLEKAYASNDRQLHIINEILHLAKIESGRIVLARQDIDLSALIHDIITEEQPDIAAARHHMDIRMPKRPLILNVDGHTLRMAIENLISNAIKYTPSGGDVVVKLFKTNEHVFIRIKDSGVGIAPQDQEKLFKQFSRLPNEMSLSVGGTGIGLYLAKHLVELHGGTVTVKSTLGKGSTFTVILPLDESL